jgi:hypothetical protein
MSKVKLDQVDMKISSSADCIKQSCRRKESGVAGRPSVRAPEPSPRLETSENVDCLLSTILTTSSLISLYSQPHMQLHRLHLQASSSFSKAETTDGEPRIRALGGNRLEGQNHTSQHQIQREPAEPKVGPPLQPVTNRKEVSRNKPIQISAEPVRPHQTSVARTDVLDGARSYCVESLCNQCPMWGVLSTVPGGVGV